MGEYTYTRAERLAQKPSKLSTLRSVQRERRALKFSSAYFPEVQENTQNALFTYFPQLRKIRKMRRRLTFRILANRLHIPDPAPQSGTWTIACCNYTKIRIFCQYPTGRKAQNLRFDLFRVVLASARGRNAHI